MLDVTDVEIHRDGGTIEFRVSGGNADGFYRLQTPALGTPEPLFKDGRRLGLGSGEELAALKAMREWLTAVCDAGTLAALAEVDGMKLWLNLPPNLSEAVPIYYIRRVIRCLDDRRRAVAEPRVQRPAAEPGG